MVDFNNNIDLVESAFAEAMGTLQNRANELVELAKSIWNENIFKKARKMASLIRKGFEKSYAIFSYFQDKENEFEKLKRLLSSNEDAKGLFIDGKKCFAICNSKRKTYFALSGTDYNLNNKINNINPISPLKVNQDIVSVGVSIKKIYRNWTYAQLSDNTECYMDPLSEPGSMAYGSSIRTLRGDLNNSTYKIEWSYSCCERKIFANIPQSNRKYEFFIKYLPCKKCLPAMGMKNKKIVSYVPFDKKGFGKNILYTTVLVHELKYLKKYKVEESYNVM